MKQMNPPDSSHTDHDEPKSPVLPARQLAEKRQARLDAFRKGKTKNFVKDHTRLIDRYFQDTNALLSGVYESINPYAVVALGGYGRQEQCIYSDIDLMFLFRDPVQESLLGMIRTFVYPLWDIGLSVAHSTRTIAECMHIFHDRNQTLVSFLDARRICGCSELFGDFQNQFRNTVLVPESDALIRWLMRTNLARHEEFGDSTYRLEPNLKDGQGGLRDYHTLLWMERIRKNVETKDDLAKTGAISHLEYESLMEALEYIWMVRNHLHDLTGKKYDQLRFTFQEEIAGILGIKEKEGQQPVEGFLGMLQMRMNFIKQLFLIHIYALEMQHCARHGVFPPLDYPKIHIKDGMLFFDSSREVAEDPFMMIRIFRESARLDIPLSPESRRLVREFVHLITEEIRKDPESRKCLEDILTAKNRKFQVLNDMLNTGILVRLVPPFAGIVDRIQYDQYHIFPIDKHSLHTVRTIKELEREDSGYDEPLAGEILQEMEDRRLLYYAALLHDVGKSVPGGKHSEKGAPMARDYMLGMGYSREEADIVAFLVKEHLTLVKTATRRDISDEDTAIQCARIFVEPALFKMIYVLTVADSISTGEKAWNSWTSSLVSTLYENVLNILLKKELASNEALRILREKERMVLGTGLGEPLFLGRLFSSMSPRYLQTPFSEEEISHHIRLYQAFSEEDPGRPCGVWRIDKIQETDTRKVTICAKDRPGIFSAISGVFTLNSINVLTAQIFTWKNGTILDIFEVTPPLDRFYEEDKWESVRKDLCLALSGELDLGEALREKIRPEQNRAPGMLMKQPKVVVDNETSRFFTIIEVYCYDFPGLLYRVTNSLYEQDLDIWVAKIATHGDQVVDVFYVRDLARDKILSRDRIERIKTHLLSVLPRIFFHT